LAFYDLSKEGRNELVMLISKELLAGLQADKSSAFHLYFADDDTYIRKSAYLVTGRLYNAWPSLQATIIDVLQQLLEAAAFKIRQTAVNAAGEIGKIDFEKVQRFFDTGLFDPHHSVRNAVIGSVKKMGEVNPEPVLAWAQTYLHHPDKEIRREICHGIELRGRKYPQDILPLLRELQFDKTARVRSTLVHVLGQIAYKKGCLETVVEQLNDWENKALVAEALDEIISVHDRYRNFSAFTREEARQYIDDHYKEKP